MSNISYLKGSRNWNTVVGCRKISAGCKNCWSEAMAKRFNQIKCFSGIRELRWDEIEKPLKWSKSSLIATCFTSDLFIEQLDDDGGIGKGVPLPFIQCMFNVIEKTPQHTYVLLTKRARRMANLIKQGDLPLTKNTWLGITVENPNVEHRVDFFRTLREKGNFWLSLEPLLGPINTEICEGFDWVVVGGESGVKARYMNPEWVYPIRDYCLEKNIPFFFKQWGKQEKGCLLNGKQYQEIPFKIPAEQLF